MVEGFSGYPDLGDLRRAYGGGAVRVRCSPRSRLEKRVSTGVSRGAAAWSLDTVALVSSSSAFGPAIYLPLRFSSLGSGQTAAPWSCRVHRSPGNACFPLLGGPHSYRRPTVCFTTPLRSPLCLTALMISPSVMPSCTGLRDWSLPIGGYPQSCLRADVVEDAVPVGQLENLGDPKLARDVSHIQLVISDAN